MKKYPCKILKGNRISVPNEIMSDLNLKEGDLLLRKRDGKALLLIPCKVVEI